MCGFVLNAFLFLQQPSFNLGRNSLGFFFGHSVQTCGGILWCDFCFYLFANIVVLGRGCNSWILKSLAFFPPRQLSSYNYNLHELKPFFLFFWPENLYSFALEGAACVKSIQTAIVCGCS